MRSFINEVKSYLQRYDNYGNYYVVYYDIFQGKDEQNIAWWTGTREIIYQWGTIYEIILVISNARLQVKFCNTSFSTNNQPAREIVTTRSGTVGGDAIRNHITNTAMAMFHESEMVLKMYNDRYSETSRNVFTYELFRLLL